MNRSAVITFNITVNPRIFLIHCQTILSWVRDLPLALIQFYWGHIMFLTRSEAEFFLLRYGVAYYRNYWCLSTTFSKHSKKGNRHKILFDHITVIPTARTYFSFTNQSGLMRAFHPNVVLWGFDHFSSSYASSKLYSALCVFVRTQLSLNDTTINIQSRNGAK